MNTANSHQQKRNRLSSAWLQWCTTCIVVATLNFQSFAATHQVRSADDVSELIESQRVSPGDVLVWADGEYSDQEIELNGLNGNQQQPITLKAATPGGVILTGESQIRTNSQWSVIEGFHFKGSADKPSAYNAVQFRGSGNIGAEHVRLTNCAFTDLDNQESSAKWVQIYGRFNRVDHCHFSGKPNKGALLTVELGAIKNDQTAEHVIEWNSFADIAPNEGSDNETIRVGYSGDQDKSAKCIVRHNLFVRCNGENEVVSNKSSHNIYSANTFRECNGALVLRHGHHATVIGNYFFGDGASNAGGIRINDSHHRIFNNHMQDLTGLTWNAALSIEGGNEPSGSDSNGYQIVDDLVVAHNSIINCSRSILLNKKHGKRSPNGIIANNLVVTRDANQKLLEANLSIAGLKWQSNVFFGPGELPEIPGQHGAISADPKLKNVAGRYRPAADSPIVDSATDGFEFIKSDIEQRPRPASKKDIGADEVVDVPASTVPSLPLSAAQVGPGFLRKATYSAPMFGQQTVRVATFNTSLNRDNAGQLKRDLSNRDNKQANAIAEIIQRVRPHLLLLNEFDYDSDGDSVRLFCDNYLKVEHNGQPAIDYPYSYTASVNTGVLSGLDYNNNGSKTDPTDAFGFGRFPGQYGMVILSKFPIDKDNVRTFQKLLWKQMPDAKLPRTADGDQSYYSATVLDAFRISSKSHWDVPIRIGDRTLHFLVCHPTPPAFDGPERRNQLRNHDEIRLFADYLSPDKSTYIKDDRGRVGGLPPDQSFVIAGDLNADPADGASENHAIRQLLNHPRVNSTSAPTSKGAVEAATIQGKANLTQKGDAKNDTADFGDRTIGNLRVDYVLPSKDLRVLNSGVFWPTKNEQTATLIKSTDHRMVWLDLRWP